MANRRRRESDVPYGKTLIPANPVPASVGHRLAPWHQNLLTFFFLEMSSRRRCPCPAATNCIFWCRAAGGAEPVLVCNPTNDCTDGWRRQFSPSRFRIIPHLRCRIDLRLNIHPPSEAWTIILAGICCNKNSSSIVMRRRLIVFLFAIKDGTTSASVDTGLLEPWQAGMI